MGPYPLFSCADWDALGADMSELDESLVSMVLVPDPLAGVERTALERAFPDLVKEFKAHLVRDLEAPVDIPAHHRRHLRRAGRSVDVELCAEPNDHLADWNRLYDELIVRHGLVGIHAFSREAFRRQFEVPGLVALRAERDGVTVGMTLWFEDPPNAHYHLGAYSKKGYEVSASYALVGAALDHLSQRGVRWVDLGGPAGSGPVEDGLVRFKRGWANEERTAYLCGRILNRRVYDRLVAERSGANPGWFPAYRAAG